MKESNLLKIKKEIEKSFSTYLPRNEWNKYWSSKIVNNRIKVLQQNSSRNSNRGKVNIDRILGIIGEFPSGLVTSELHRFYCERFTPLCIRQVRHYVRCLVGEGLVCEEYLGLGFRGRSRLLRLVK